MHLIPTTVKLVLITRKRPFYSEDKMSSCLGYSISEFDCCPPSDTNSTSTTLTSTTSDNMTKSTETSQLEGLEGVSIQQFIGIGDMRRAVNSLLISCKPPPQTSILFFDLSRPTTLQK